MPTLVLIFFWIIVIGLLIFLFYLLKKYLGRVIIICVFVLLLYGIYWLINPAGARGIFNAIASLPTTTIRTINNRFSKDSSTTGQNNQEIGLLSGEISLTGSLSNGDLEPQIQTPQDLPANTQSDTTIEVTTTTNTTSSSGESTPQITTGTSVAIEQNSGDKQNPQTQERHIFSAAEYKVSMTDDGNILVEKRNPLTEEDEEDDGSYYIIESNPKNNKKSDSTTTDQSKTSTPAKKSSSSLSANDLNEAHQIFNF